MHRDHQGFLLHAVMSSNGETNVVLRGVTHGAVDFLIKPVRIEELRNAWQHVVRRRRESVSLLPFQRQSAGVTVASKFPFDHRAATPGKEGPALQGSLPCKRLLGCCCEG